MDSAKHLDIVVGGLFAHKTPIEGKETLDHILRNSSFLAYPCEPQESNSRHESPSSAKSYPLPSTSQNSSVEPSPEPQTSKEEEIQPSKFSFQFKDDLMKTLETPRITFASYPRQPLLLPTKIFVKEEWSEEVRRSSKAIRISSPSTIIYCSIRGTTVEALHDPTAEACIMSEFLMDTFIGSMPLVPTNRLFKSPSGLIFECRGSQGQCRSR
jgi:hypothetical protein